MKKLKTSFTGILLMAALLVPQFAFADVLPSPDEAAEKSGSIVLPVIIALVAAAVIAILIIRSRKNKKK